jgi:hypothetical protein
MFTDIADFYADQTVLIYTTARPDRQVAQAIGDRGRAELINKKYPAGF